MVGSLGNHSTGSESIDVTSFIQSLAGGGNRYAGFYVESVAYWDPYYIYSSEATDPADRPTLTVAFSSAATSVQIADAQAAGIIRNDDAEMSIADRQRPEGNSDRASRVPDPDPHPMPWR